MLKPYAKFIVALVGAAVSIALSLDVPAENVDAAYSVVVAILTALGVWAVPNETNTTTL